MDPVLRQLNIKTNVLRRAVKELASYVKEVEIEQSRLSQYENDAVRTRQQMQVIHESREMVSQIVHQMEDKIASLEAQLKTVAEEGLSDEGLQAAANSEIENARAALAEHTAE
ncbi:hypothetical protein PCE1_004244 [Barthelona sp. PCE]